MRMVNLVLLLVAVVLSTTTLGCGSSSDTAVASDTASGDYVTRPDFESYRLSQNENWKNVDGRINYLRTEQDKIKETVKKHDDQLACLTGGPVTPSPAPPPQPVTHLNNDPLVNSGCNLERVFWNGKWYDCQLASGSSSAPASPPAVPAAEPVVPPGVHQVPLEPNLADYIRQRFPVSEQNQQAILAKQDETKELIQSGFQRIEGALTGLNNRVTALENARHPTPAPQLEPKVRADK